MSSSASTSRRGPRSHSHQPLTFILGDDLGFAGPETTSSQDVDILPLYNALVIGTDCRLSFAAPSVTPIGADRQSDRDRVAPLGSDAKLTFAVNAVFDKNFRYRNQRHAIKALTTFYTNTGYTNTISPSASVAVADMADWIRGMSVATRRGWIETYFARRAHAEPEAGGNDGQEWQQDWVDPVPDPNAVEAQDWERDWEDPVPDLRAVEERGWEKDWVDAGSERGSVAGSEWEKYRVENFAKIGNGLNIHEERTRQARLNVERRRAGRKAESSIKSRSEKLALGAITLLTALGLGAAAYHFCSRSADTYTD